MEKDRLAAATQARGKSGRNRGVRPENALAQKRRGLDTARQVTSAFVFTRPLPFTLNT